MLRDRGIKKWTAMMLHEHVDALRQLKHEEKAHSTERTNEEYLQEIITYALQTSASVCLTLWQDGREERLVGTLHDYDAKAHTVFICMNESERQIALSTIETALLLDDGYDS